jgi:chromate transport protein ChrA
VALSIQRWRRITCSVPQQPPKVPALTLGWIFLYLGATAFGGLGTTLALIERELGQA